MSVAFVSTNGYVLIVDATDYPRVSGVNWYVNPKRGYVTNSSNRGRRVHLNQFITGGTGRHSHRNNNPLDFRRENIV